MTSESTAPGGTPSSQGSATPASEVPLGRPAGNRRSVTLLVAGMPGLSVGEGAGATLGIEPQALVFTLQGLAHLQARMTGLPSPAVVQREQVTRIRRNWTGGYVVCHTAGWRSPFFFIKFGDNARLEADLRDAGYDVESPRFSPRARKLALAAILTADAAFFIGLNSAYGPWLGWLVPLFGSGTVILFIWNT